jgi:hypothetical protein
MKRHLRRQHSSIADFKDRIALPEGEECSDLIEQHALEVGKARDVVVKSMLGDQPLHLNRGSRPVEQGASDVASA